MAANFNPTKFNAEEWVKICKAAGMKYMVITAKHIDGKSLFPIINGDKQLERQLFWYYPHNHGAGHLASAAIQDGNDKLIWFLEEDRVELYNIEQDISETTDLSSAFPQKANELKKQLINWIENTKPSDKNKN